MRLAGLLPPFFAAALVTHGCSGGRRAPTGYGATSGATTTTSSGSGGAGGSSDPGDCVDTEGACGDETHTVTRFAPNLYFVFDASSSMSAKAPGKDATRYEVVRATALDLVANLGPLVNVGVATFPSDTNACGAGKQTMPVTPGDPFAAKDHPTLEAFAKATDRTLVGGTPTAATLDALRPTLAHLDGRTVVLLLTDGGPNCNADLVCRPENCISVIEGDCAPGKNCCEPGTPYGGPTFCVDRARTVAAVEAVHALGIDVYVIGVAELSAYQTVLDAMAVAGGVPASGSTRYVDAKDLDGLAGILASIAAAAIPCEIALTKPPVEQGLTNVYLGCKAIPYDAANGWTWQGDAVVKLHGAACANLRTGKYGEVKVVTGCPTERPK